MIGLNIKKKDAHKCESSWERWKGIGIGWGKMFLLHVISMLLDLFDDRDGTAEKLAVEDPDPKLYV